jgi:2'-5' RNA ligase
VSRDRRWESQPPDAGPRLFIAVPLPEPARDALARLVESIPPPAEGRPVRWVRLDGLHVTVRFLGPTAPDRFAGVEEAMRRAGRAEHPFAVTIRGAGAFPSVHRPRALWVAVDRGADDFGRIAGALDRELRDEGWPADDRPFRPHLTLARSDGVRAGPVTAGALIAAARDFSAEFVAERLVLFESRTGGGPARYEPLAEQPLGG